MTKLDGELDEVGATATLRPLVAGKEIAPLAQAVKNARQDLRRRPLMEPTEQVGPRGRVRIRGHSRHMGTRRVDEGSEQPLSVDPSSTDLNDSFDPLPGENDARERCEQEQRRAEDRQRKGDGLYREHRDRMMKEFDVLNARLKAGSTVERIVSVQHAAGPKRR